MNSGVPDQVTQEAIDWLLRLEQVPTTDPAHHEFEQWWQRSAEHQAAWVRVSTLVDSALTNLQAVPGQVQIASRALRSLPNPSRRQLLGKGMAVLLVGTGAASLINRMTPLSGMRADVHTATGERKTLVLADGSRLSLNARSAADIHFDAQYRLIELRLGELQVEVADDPTRPLIVATTEGLVRSLGTQFMVRQEDGRSLVSVQQHSVFLTTRKGTTQRIDAGEAFRFDMSHSMEVAPSLATRTDWMHGRIEVRNEPLGHLIDALRPYRSGLLRISPKASEIRVFGTFLVDDIERTLSLLSETLPIRINSHGPWLTQIDVR
ncbi:FecR domain-containing protein [Pseudomonas sp. PDM16]|uniref:FecR domain-containing protein n=1 Tax=Pseudomonas sp. PDM16 TaxID=2769292 RepID=UPI00177E2313|nr:FecR domain-containing protein [Pseudomonas sp. PDM16]MBD9415240.1 FecR domain-containing protein [Pseudomonas sp. PDM16]